MAQQRFERYEDGTCIAVWFEEVPDPQPLDTAQVDVDAAGLDAALLKASTATTIVGLRSAVLDIGRAIRTT